MQGDTCKGFGQKVLQITQQANVRTRYAQGLCRLHQRNGRRTSNGQSEVMGELACLSTLGDGNCGCQIRVSGECDL
jgi:hypothetical protein